MQEIAKHLQGRPNAHQRAEAEKFLGFNCSALHASFLMQESLQSWACLEAICYDPMHCYWSNGLVAQELGLWYTALESYTSFKHQVLESYVRSGWRIGQRFAGCASLVKLFRSKMWKSNKDFKGDAVDCVAVLPICVQFGEEIVRPVLPDFADQLDSLKSLHKVCCYLHQLKDSKSNLGKGLLLDAQKEHMKAFQKAYGRTCTRPKAHYALHLENQHEQIGKLLDCFACERKHREYKALAEEIVPNASFSTTVLLSLQEKNFLQDVQSTDTVLLGPLRALPFEEKQWKCFKEAKWEGLHMVAGECWIFSQTEAVEVQCFLQWKEQLCARCLCLTALPHPASSPFRSLWQKTNDAVLVFLSDVKAEYETRSLRECTLDGKKAIWLLR